MDVDRAAGAAPARADRRVGDGARRHRLHRLVYPLRMLGMGLAGLPASVVLWQHDAPTGYWATLLFTAILWPHIAWWRVHHGSDPDRTERQNLLVDSAIAGFLVPLMHFNLLPSALVATLALVDKINTGVRGLWRRSLPWMAGGVLAGGVLTGFAWRPETDMTVILACMPLLLIHTVAVSLNGYRLVRRVNDQNIRLDELSRTDALTGLDNRRQWEQHAEHLLRDHRTGDGMASLVMVDVDGFKAINDERGHAVGDDVLRGVAGVLRDCVGDDDRAARYGGDEFALVLAMREDAAVVAAERIRTRVAAMSFAAAPGLHCTVSLGVAGANRRYFTLRRWMVAADAALYRAKRSGRDRVRTPAGHDGDASGAGDA